MTQEPPDKRARANYEAGLAMSLPTLMLSGPLSGLLLAFGIVWAFGLTDPWAGRVKTGGIILGTMAAMRESYKVLRKIAGGRSKNRRDGKP